MKLPTRLAVIGAVLVASAFGAAGAVAWRNHATALDTAGVAAVNLGLVLARQTAGAVEVARTVLLDLDEQVGPLTTEALAGPVFAELLRRRAARLRPANIVLATDPAGRVLASSVPLTPARAERMARSMRALKAVPGDDCAAYGHPEPGRDAGDLLFAHPLTGSDGMAAGALVALLPAESLLTLPPARALSDGALVVLLCRDGAALLGYPTPAPAPLADAVGHDVATHGGGLYRVPAAAGFGPRIVAVEPVPGQPLAVLVSLDEHEALAGWRRDAALIAVGTLAGVISVLLLLVALRRQLRRVDESRASQEAANDDLARKSRELETTLAHMDQGLLMVDADQRVAVCNRRAIEMLELPPGLVAARPTPGDLLADPAATDAGRRLAHLLAELTNADGQAERARIQERRRPDGRVIEVRSVPLAGGGMVCTYTDTTARVLDDERFRLIVDASPLAIALLSIEEFRFVQVNPACCALLGRPAGELIGRPWHHVVHPEDADVPATGGNETRLLTGTGDIVWTRLTRSLVPDAPGRPPLVLVIGEDVTREHEMEARLTQTQRLEAVGQLTGGVAHDFNNLLGVIMLDAEQLAESADAEAARLAGEILGAAASGAELTHRLLAFARRQALQPRAMDLNAAVVESAKLLQRTLGEAIRIRLAPAEGLWPVRADPSQVGDALLNLALNARDAMPEGGALAIGTANHTIAAAEATAELAAGDYVEVWVSDTGAGMAPPVLARAVEPFFTTKPAGAGSGLGLSMIYGFARQSGGALHLESTPGQGTTVRLLLPRAREAAVTAKETGRPALPGGHETVLLVDDNAAVRRVTARQLAGLGYTVREADGGAEALALLGAGLHADLLFTDVVMPGGMTGPGLARAAAGVLPGLKVLFTSGYARAPDAGGQPEPSPLIRKPYRRHELASAVRAALERARAGA